MVKSTISNSIQYINEATRGKGHEINGRLKKIVNELQRWMFDLRFSF
jgi:hypothetical protein